MDFKEVVKRQNIKKEFFVGDEISVFAPRVVSVNNMCFFDEIEYDCYDLFKKYCDLFGFEINDIDESGIDFYIAKAIQDKILEVFEDAGIKINYYREKSEKSPNLPKQLVITADELQLDSDDIYKDEEALADILNEYLSDAYDFCNYGFSFEVVYNEFNEPSEVILSDIKWDINEVTLDDKLTGAVEHSNETECINADLSETTESEPFHQFGVYKDLKKALEGFDKDGREYSCGDWRIASGGYDLWWQGYYRDVPIFECVSGEINVFKENAKKNNLSMIILNLLLAD